MPQHIPGIVALVLAAGLADAVSAQTIDRLPTPVAHQAAAPGGRVQGQVVDEGGDAVSGVSIVAMGTILAMARSDDRGRFGMSLPPGEYILRATRDGYVSTYREPVRVQFDARIERNITLLRVTPTIAQDAVADETASAVTPDHSHTELAWRLRHLRRVILRDRGAADVMATGDGAFAPRSFGSTLRSVGEPAGPWFDSTFGGQIDVLTSASFSPAGGWFGSELPRSVAYVAVGAPVGTHGEWNVRAAMSAGEPSSWVMLGQYQANTENDHAFSAGVSRGVQQLGETDQRFGSSETRTVGGLFAFDRWQVSRSLEVAYGARFDRYDYLAAPDLISPDVSVRVRGPGRLSLTVAAAQHMVAPGASEFLPPASAGVWMPPERTFSALSASSPMEAARVRRIELGIARTLGPTGSTRSVSVRYFREATRNQAATIFGVGPDASHYQVGTPGHVNIDGWTTGINGQLLPTVRGSIDYTISTATWSDSAVDTSAVRRVAPSAARLGRERMHDLTAAIDAEFVSTATAVRLAYRASSAFAVAGGPGGQPGSAGRFDVEVRQELPYEPVGGSSSLHVLVAFRNLFRDLDRRGSIYDELLTVAPPTRLVGGLQVRF